VFRKLLDFGGDSVANGADDLCGNIASGAGLDKQSYKPEARLGCLYIFFGMTCNMMKQLLRADILPAPP
jgi:hypothetical protein